MSITAWFRDMSPAALDALRRDSSLVDVYLDYDPQQVADIELTPPIAFPFDPSFAAQIQDHVRQQREALQRAPERLQSAGLSNDDLGAPIDIHKEWHALHFLLCSTLGHANPGALAILGGLEVGDSLEYGPPRCFTPAECTDIATALASVTAQDLIERYDVAAMTEADLYPGGWHELDWSQTLPVAFETVQQFYIAASARGRATLLALR